MSAKLVLTFDFELGWGAIENSRWREREGAGVYGRLRHVLPVLLRELEVLEVPITWAVVGGMLDPHVVDHLDHLPQDLRDLTARAVKEANRSTFDGRDLAEMVEGSERQVFASHSYSHVRFSHEGVDEHFVLTEMKHCEAVWCSVGAGISTFVFPQNHEGYHSVLVASGINKVRGAELEHNRGIVQKMLTNVILSPPISIQSSKDGLESHTGSLFFNVPPGSRARLALLQTQSVRLINAAIRKNATAHIYLHPFNLAESSLLFSLFVDMLNFVVKKRDKGEIEIVAF